MILAIAIGDLPAINAALNATSTILLIAAYVSIKRRRIRAHAYLIIAALVTSSAFLLGYLTYHAHFGTTRVADAFPRVSSSFRGIYLLILFPHLTLAMVMLPMIATSLRFAYQRRWEAHRRLSPYSFWIWLYVSVTGVIIYWLLYHWFPDIQGRAV